MFVLPILPVTFMHLEAARAAYERILETRPAVAFSSVLVASLHSGLAAWDRQQNGHKDSAEDQDKETEKAEKAKPQFAEGTSFWPRKKWCGEGNSELEV